MNDARVLLLTGSPKHYMAPPLLAADQLTGGPDWQDERDAAGGWTTVTTPLGAYDVAPVLAKLPPHQKPDILVCLVDAGRRNVPCNLAAFRGPKVLLVADTHHMASPVTNMVRYAASEPYDRVVLLYDRHHASIFHAAGLRNLFWFPGLTFPHDDAFVRQSRRDGAREAQVAFVGQAGKLHPRRSRMLAALTAAGVPLAMQAIGQRDALPFYGSSLLGFNSSLNGDFNLRVFEILASGALLLTDRLAPASGFDHLLKDGRDCLLYGDEGELMAKAATSLRQPEEARRIAIAGTRWFDDNMGERARREMFMALALDGRAPSLFPLPRSELGRLHFRDTRELLASAMVYEGVQELHRVQPEVRVAVDASTPANVSQLCATLPRVRVERDTAGAGTDLLVTGTKNAATAAASQATHVWCWDATPAQLASVGQIFSARGYVAASPELGFYSRPPSKTASPAPGATVSLADLLAEAERRLKAREATAAESLLREIEKSVPDQGQVQLLLGHALKQQGKLPEALAHHRRAVKAPVGFSPKGRRRRVAFLVQHPPVWSSTRTIIEAFQADGDWDTTVIAAPYLHAYASPEEQQAIFDFLDKQRVAYVRWDSLRLEPDFADVLFFQNPYDVTRPAGFQTPELLRWVPRLVYVPYGLEIGGGNVNHGYQFNLPLQQLAWLICARSERHRIMFQQHCLTGVAHVEVTGHPKMDPLVHAPPPAPDDPFLTRAKGRPIICWNPQFDVRPEGNGFSTFAIHGQTVLDLAERHPDLFLVVRPHPLLFGTLLKRGIWSQAQLEAWKARVEAAENIALDLTPSYVGLFQASQAMLSDASSFLLEYAATGKPVLYLHNPNGPGLNDDGAFVREHGYTAERIDEIAAFFAMIERGEDPKRDRRREVYPSFMLVPDEGAGQRIKRTVEARMSRESTANNAGGMNPCQP